VSIGLADLKTERPFFDPRYTKWHELGERLVARRVRENLMHGSERGRRKHDLPNPW